MPSIAGNAFFAALFGFLLLIGVALAITYRTWGVGASLVIGLSLESAAYIARIMINKNDFDTNIFIIYIYFITLGATFISAAIYLCLSRIVVAYGESYARFKPRTYSVFFMICDFIAIALQAAGGGMLQVVGTEEAGQSTLIAGLAFQTFSLLLFATACADFAVSVRRGKETRNPDFVDLLSSRRWVGFLGGT